jgi:enamine deaminase RidA (YjgF/YER057c/UK114 family)
LEKRELAGKTIVSTGSKWEPLIGYSRAVRKGNIIAVTGTVGLNPDGTWPSTPGEQMSCALEKIVASIELLGGKRTDVIRTRIYLSDITTWEEVGKVHAKMFHDVMPATTLVEVGKLIDSAAKVEVEADAVV